MKDHMKRTAALDTGSWKRLVGKGFVMGCMRLHSKSECFLHGGEQMPCQYCHQATFNDHNIIPYPILHSFIFLNSCVTVLASKE